MVDVRSQAGRGKRQHGVQIEMASVTCAPPVPQVIRRLDLGCIPGRLGAERSFTLTPLRSKRDGQQLWLSSPTSSVSRSLASLRASVNSAFRSATSSTVRLALTYSISRLEDADPDHRPWRTSYLHGCIRLWRILGVPMGHSCGRDPRTEAS